MTTSNTSKRSFRTRVSVLEVVSLSSKPSSYYSLTPGTTTYLHFKVCSDRSVPFRLVRIEPDGQQVILDSGFILPRDSVLYNWAQFPPDDVHLLDDEDPLAFDGMGFTCDWKIHCCRSNCSDLPELSGELHETAPLIIQHTDLPDYVPVIYPVVVESRKILKRHKIKLPPLAPQPVAPVPAKAEPVAATAETPVLKSVIGKMQL